MPGTGQHTLLVRSDIGPHTPALCACLHKRLPCHLLIVSFQLVFI